MFIRLGHQVQFFTTGFSFILYHVCVCVLVYVIDAVFFILLYNGFPFRVLQLWRFYITSIREHTKTRITWKKLSKWTSHKFVINVITTSVMYCSYDAMMVWSSSNSRKLPILPVKWNKRALKWHVAKMTLFYFFADTNKMSILIYTRQNGNKQLSASCSWWHLTRCP